MHMAKTPALQQALLLGSQSAAHGDADALPPPPPCCRICLEPCALPSERLGCACKSDAAHAACAARWFSVRASGGTSAMRTATACEVCCHDATALPRHVRRAVR